MSVIPLFRDASALEQAAAFENRIERMRAARRVAGRRSPADLFPRTPIERHDPADVAKRLTGRTLPPMDLSCFHGRLAPLEHSDLHVIYFYPGAPCSPDAGEDNALADALQHKGFRDLANAWRGVWITGISTQSKQGQLQSAWANGIGDYHALAHDGELRVACALPLPTYPHDGQRCYQRLALIAWDNLIVKVFFPTHAQRSAQQVLTWMRLEYGLDGGHTYNPRSIA